MESRQVFEGCERLGLVIHRKKFSMSSPSKTGSPKKGATSTSSKPSPVKVGDQLPVPPTSSQGAPSPTKQRRVTGSAKQRKFALGDSVQVNFNEEVDIWTAGQISAVHDDGDKYDVTYTDGHVESNVSNVFIRLAADLGSGEGGGGGGAGEGSDKEALARQVQELQRTIEELRKGSGAGTGGGAKSTPSSKAHGSGSGSDRDALELDLASLPQDELLKASQSLRSLFFLEEEKNKELTAEKAQLTKKEEQATRSARTAQKASEEVISKLKAQIAELSKKGNSKAAAATAASAADAIEAAAKEQAEHKAALDDLRANISELTQRLDLAHVKEKKHEQENDRIARLLRTSEDELTKVKALNEELSRKADEASASGDQVHAHVQVLSKEKEELEKAKKAAGKEIQSLKKNCDELKEAVEANRKELEDLRAGNEALNAELKSFHGMYGVEAKARNKMLAYFEVGLRCEVLTVPSSTASVSVGAGESLTQKMGPTWLPGRITKKNEADSTFNVYLDDGVSKTDLKPELIRPIMNMGPFLLNDRVEIEVRSAFFPGKISKINPDGTYVVYCDNGTVDSKVPLGDGLRLILPQSSTSLGDLFQLGDAVLCNHQGKGLWFSGSINGVSESSYSVLFDFGETDPSVPYACIRPWCPPQTTTNCLICQSLARVSRQVDECKKYIGELQKAHEMADGVAGLGSASLESNRLKFLISNAWVFVCQESKILTDCVSDMQQYFATDSLMNHSNAPFGTVVSVAGKASSGSVQTNPEPISKERFEKLKREKVEEERRRRMVIEEERRQAEKARKVAEETFAGETIRKAATKNDLAVLNSLVPRWSGDAVLSQPTDSSNITPVWAAAERGNVAALEILLTHGASQSVPDVYGSTALAEAASNGHERALSILIKAGGDVNQPNLDGCSPLYRAVGNGHKGAVNILLKAGAKVDAASKSGRTPVGMAAWTGVVECLEQLLEKKADVNKADTDKWTPIFSASANNHLECLDLLLRAKGDISLANNKGQQALYIAAKNGHVRIVGKLLEKGANVNAQDVDGDTAIYAAAQEGHIEVMRLLVDNGADILLSNKNGLTPAKIAAQAFQAEAVAFLKIVEAEEMEKLRREALNAKKELAEVKAKLAAGESKSGGGTKGATTTKR